MRELRLVTLINIISLLKYGDEGSKNESISLKMILKNIVSPYNHAHTCGLDFEWGCGNTALVEGVGATLDGVR